MVLLVPIVQALVVIAWLLLLGRVIMSWLDPFGQRPITRSLVRLTEPVLAPIRNTLPRTGQLDLSPLVLFVVLALVMRIVLSW